MAEIDPERLEVATQDFPGIETYNSVSAMLKKSDVNLVTIITPHDTHGKLALQCLDAGVGVVVEKPMAITSKEVKAMIAAAKADGQIDTGESQAILNQINSLDLPAEDKAFLFEEYGRPLDIQGLASAVDSPEHGAEVYAASALMVDPPSAAEQIFLDSLARALGLEAGLVQEIHATVAANRA